MSAEPTGPAGRQFASLLPATPDAYPQNLDLVRDALLVLRLDEAAYRAASFLDDRILSPSMQGAWLPLDAAVAAARQVADPRPLHFIFHAGHVGSTLLSRLLDETGLVLPIREPLPLRTLADAHDGLGRPESLLDRARFDGLLEAMLRLWSRGYPSTRAVVLKATSSAGRLAPALLGARPQARAVYLQLRAEPYLATLLGGPNSLVDLRGHGPGRMRRLAARFGPDLAPLSSLSRGELAALGWLAESLSLQDALQACPDRVLALDFDAFEADVRAGLDAVLAQFGLPHDAGTVGRLAASGLLRRYSKAPELPFPPGERAARLADSRRMHRDEIAKGMAWLAGFAREHGDAAKTIAAGGA